MTPKRIFITYGTKNFDLQKKHIINLAKSSNIEVRKGSWILDLEISNN